MSSSFTRLVLTLAAALLPPQLTAAPVEYALRDWHPADGLPSDDVARVLPARDGFLWVATSGGVARFDGAHFETVPTPGADGRRLTLARALVETPELGIVVAPVGGGLLATRGGGFQPVPLPTAAQGRAFTLLFAEEKGTLWGGSDDGVVTRLSAGAAEFFPTSDDLNGRPVIFFASDAQRRLWVANGTNLHRYEHGQLARIDPPRERAELRIGSSRGDGPWIVAHDRLLKYEGAALVEKFTLPPLVSAHYIQALHEDRRGALWIGTRSQGVFVFEGGVLTRAPSTHEDALWVCEDAEGDIWTAANGGGLNRLRPKIFRLFDKSAGLPVNFSATVCEDVGGAMWFANRDGGVVRLRPDGTIQTVPAPAAWPVISAVSVAPQPQGGVWATAGPGLFAIAEQPSPVMEQLSHPPVPIIRCTLVAKSGDLWFSADPDRIGRRSGGKYDFFGRAEGYDGKQVRHLAEDASGRIWCGSSDGKLFRQSGDRFETVPLNRVVGSINAILPESDGRVWLGTAESGLVVRRDGQWHTLDTTHGLPDNFITQILADDRGNLWFGSVSGIFRASRREILDCLDQKIPRIHAVVLGRDEGLKDLSCLGFYQPAAWKSRDGLLWFASRQGVLRLDPALALSEAAAPPVHIEQVSTDERAQPVRGTFFLPAGFRKLEFRFSVLCLATPERVRTRYRLDGFDDDWLIAPPGHAVSYPRLPPGTYRFNVSAALGDGSGAESHDALEFTVVPPWWQTLWFRLFLGVAALAMAVVTARIWSHRRLRTRLEKLERESAIERERTRIAQNIHDDLGASLTRISLLTQHAQHDAAGAAAHFEKIYGSVTEITRSMDEIVWAVNPKYDDLESLAYYLGNFAQSFLSVAGIRCRLDMPAHLPASALTSQIRHHLFLCCKEALNNVVKHAHADAVTLTLVVADARVTISIADNGRGLPPPSVESSPSPDRPAGGNGLDNMRRRMAAIGGSCDIVPAAGSGTTVRFSVSLFSPPT